MENGKDLADSLAKLALNLVVTATPLKVIISKSVWPTQKKQKKLYEAF